MTLKAIFQCGVSSEGAPRNETHSLRRDETCQNSALLHLVRACSPKEVPPTVETPTKLGNENLGGKARLHRLFFFCPMQLDPPLTQIIPFHQMWMADGPAHRPGPADALRSRRCGPTSPNSRTWRRKSPSSLLAASSRTDTEATHHLDIVIKLDYIAVRTAGRLCASCWCCALRFNSPLHPPTARDQLFWLLCNMGVGTASHKVGKFSNSGYAREYFAESTAHCTAPRGSVSPKPACACGEEQPTVCRLSTKGFCDLCFRCTTRKVSEMTQLADLLTPWLDS